MILLELRGMQEIKKFDLDLINKCSARVEAVPRETWQAFFESQGMLHPLPRIQMLDGFNQGWIDFEGGETGTIKGKVELPTVLQELVDRAG